MAKGLPEYWHNRATRLKVDIDHVKRQLVHAKETEEITHLKQLKSKLTEELMIALEAVEQFHPPRA